MNKESIIRKAKSLINFTEEKGCTEHEAALAAERLQELLTKYQLSMMDLNVGNRTGNAIEDEIKFDYVKVPAWLQNLCANIGAGFECKVIFSKWLDKDLPRYKQKFRVILIGHELDVEVAKYFIDTLYDKLYEEAHKQGSRYYNNKKELNRYISSFIIGASFSIYKRLAAQRTKQEVENSNVTALVLCKKTDIAAFIKEKYPKLRSKSMSMGTGTSGYGDGAEFGKGVNLTKGINSSSKPNQLTG